jgi:hypothetical protein
MWTSATKALLLLGLACGACGSVSTTGDAPGRPVACNGGPVDVLKNGNFDATDPPWRQEPAAILCGQPRITPDSGAASACLGGGGDNSVSTVSMEISLPAGAASARLTGKICIDTQETAAADNDVVTFDILEGVAPIGALGRRSNQQGVIGCQFTAFMLEAPLTRDPATATFRIQSTLNVGKSTSFYVDTLALTVACR